MTVGRRFLALAGFSAELIFACPVLAQTVGMPVTLYDDPVQQVDPWKYFSGQQSTIDRQDEKLGDVTTFEPADRLGAIPDLTIKLRSVGRLEMKIRAHATGEDRSDFCTAWLIDRSIAITNQHCVANNDVKSWVEGRIRFGSHAGNMPGKVFRVTRILEQNANYDFALLELEGAPGDSFGTVQLDVREAISGEPLLVIGHPQAHPLMVQRANCYSWNPAVSADDLQHRCDTLPGNSGSIIYAQKDGRVVGLHYSAPGYLRDYNLAKLMPVVVKQSPLLSRLYAAHSPSSTGSAPETSRSESMSVQVTSGVNAPAPAQADSDAEALIRDALAAEAREDFRAAIPAFLKAYEAGIASAAGYLGRVYALTRDFKNAEVWYRMAAHQGDARGYAGIGYLLDYGPGGSRRRSEEAVSWYQKAAGLNFAAALYFLARLHEPGSDRPSLVAAPKNMSIAVALHKQAGDLGYPLANYQLGRIYAAGLSGVAKDETLAATYFERAARSGNQRARNWLRQRRP